MNARLSKPCPECSGSGFETFRQAVFGVCRLCCGTGVEPECPNRDDPVLCKYAPDLGKFVPEAGCPLHDPDPKARPAREEERR